MSRHDVAFLACRLLALFFAYQLVIGIPQALMYMPFGYGGFSIDNWWQILVSISGPAGSALCALVTWFLAPSISRQLLPAHAEDAPPIRANPASLLSVAFAIVGLLTISNGLSYLSWTLSAFAAGDASSFDSEGTQWWLAGTGLVECVIGLILLIGSRNFAAFFTRIRRSGQRHSPAE